MKSLRAVLAAAVLAAGGAVSAEDCGACKPGKVCQPHEGADETAIKEASPLLRDKDMLKRRDGIEKLATAATKHLNARSKKITNEIAKLLSDPDPNVKALAAERLGQAGDEPIAASVLASEAGKAEKGLSVDKPGKEDDLKKWDNQVMWLNGIYSGLGKLTTQPAAASAFEKAIINSNPWICKIAAENVKGFKKHKGVIKALVSALASYFAKNVTEGNSAAWTAVSMALPEVTQCNDIATQKDGADAARWNAQWQKWYRENEKLLK